MALTPDPPVLRDEAELHVTRVAGWIGLTVCVVGLESAGSQVADISLRSVPRRALNRM